MGFNEIFHALEAYGETEATKIREAYTKPIELTAYIKVKADTVSDFFITSDDTKEEERQKKEILPVITNILECCKDTYAIDRRCEQLIRMAVQ